VSLHILASGTLAASPQRREGGRGPFTTATVRTASDEPVFVSVIAFGDHAKRLMEFSKGDPIAISGRGRLTTWNGPDGTARHGISVAADQIIGAKPRSRRSAPPRRKPPARPVGHTAPLLPDDGVSDLWAAGDQ
jgi:single-stranded DNA-binding protein